MSGGDRALIRCMTLRWYLSRSQALVLMLLVTGVQVTLTDDSQGVTNSNDDLSSHGDISTSQDLPDDLAEQGTTPNNVSHKLNSPYNVSHQETTQLPESDVNSTAEEDSEHFRKSSDGIPTAKIDVDHARSIADDTKNQRTNNEDHHDDTKKQKSYTGDQHGSALQSRENKDFTRQDQDNDAVRVPRDWIISHWSGADNDDCGSAVESACQTVDHVMPLIRNGDVVYFLGNQEPDGNINLGNKDNDRNYKMEADMSYEFCRELSTIVKYSFSITAMSGMNVNIGCARQRKQDEDFSWRLTTKEQVHVTLRNIRFINMKMDLHDVSHTIENCTFKDAKLNIWTSLSKVHSSVSQSSWDGKTDCQSSGKCIPTSEINMMGRFLQLSVKDCSFLHSKLSIQAAEDTEILISGCVFDGYVSHPPVFPANTIAMFTTILTNLTVKNCIFRNQYHWNPIESVMNIFEASLLVRLMTRGGFAPAGSNNVTVTISDTVFENNERGLTFQGGIEHITVENCQFLHNTAMHAGAAILLLTSRFAYVRNSTFDSNAAGNFRISETRHPGDEFSIDGDEVKISSNCCKGAISLIGKGGAIRVQKGDMTIEDCSFTNNTARLLGGAIFVDRSGKLTIINSQFTNTPKHMHSTQGDIMYSNGNVAIKGASMLVMTANNHISQLQHNGEHWSMAVHDITLLCPIGHRLRVVNTSSYGVTPYVGLRRSYMLDQLSYFCESCPRHKYSTDRGYMRYKLNHGVYEYFTLMINGKSPSSEFDGTYDYHDIVCQECPYGAECDNTIRALPNFWGFKHSGGIRFQHCPKGYCCPNKICPTFDICAYNRRGRLCSRCVDGYSEALFSSLCVPNDQCGPLWIWIFFFSMGIVYMLFLLFQKDIRDFIFTKPSPVEEYIPCLKKKVPQSPTRNHEKIMLNGKAENDEHDDYTYADGLAYDAQNNEKASSPVTDDAGDNAGPVSSQPTDMGSIILIIMMYYFQDSLLFSVKVVGQEDEKKRSQLKAILLGFFKFRLEVAHFIENVCLMEGLSSSMKLLVKTLLVPYTLLLFGVLCIFYRCMTLSRRSKQVQANSFLVKLSIGFTLALLFMYQRLATTAFTLLNCVPVGDDSVLFIDGTVTCYQYWQYGVIAYAACCIVPFCLVLCLGPGLLKEDLIGVPQFFAACIIPLPFVLYWVVLRFMRRKRPPIENDNFSPQAEAVYKVLQGPFKDIRNDYLGSVCWAGVLIGRRLLLVLLFTFVNNTLIRVLTMLFSAFFMLLHHVHVQPYKDSTGNIAGSASVSCMMIVGGINLVRAGFEAAEYIPQGPNKTLMKFMAETENVLMLWFPLVIMCLTLLALTIKITLLICGCIRRRQRRSAS